jgi:hypothetical protein
MKLEQYKTESYEFSKLSSDLVRQFAFAGIAIIWIFKFDKPEKHLIPEQLFLPLLLMVITLAFDLFQYLFPTVIYTIFFLYNEKKHKGDTDIDIKASGWFTTPGWMCFTCKIICLISGYSLIVSFILDKI